MFDLEIHLDNLPGALSHMGRALGAAGVSIEGGGAWVIDGKGVAHFLVADAEKAVTALAAQGIEVVASRPVVIQRLRQAVPGQLGDLTGRMAAAGVNIEILYSDHDNRLVIVPDDLDAARAVAEAWGQDSQEIDRRSASETVS